MDVTTKRHELLKPLMVLQQKMSELHEGISEVIRSSKKTIAEFSQDVLQVRHHGQSWAVASKKDIAEEVTPERPRLKM
jgi:hypothetical protein